MELQLKGKKAFVSGSTQGIGFSIAKVLHEEGADVIINGRTEKKVQNSVQKLSKLKGGTVTGIAADFSEQKQVTSIIDQFAELDILINNVGFFEPKAFPHISDQDWFEIFEVNVLSGIRLSRHYLPKMLDNGWGRIIFISSESAINIPEEMIHYGMTKTAQLAVSRGLAELTKGSNVTVNSVLPGPTRSEGIEDFLTNLAEEENKAKNEIEQEFFNDVRPTSLIQRFAEVNEVANLVAFLSSPLSSAINGTSLRADGGVVKSIL
ncbi:SDR family oxidoreductase [Gracilimonas sp.]|uniref:SDR family NAD(P)-dependent oxidoreductase n=1 Tax=Gracilimonas sp. TaxID=1974203 RepID=UPI0032EE25E3